MLLAQLLLEKRFLSGKKNNYCFRLSNAIVPVVTIFCIIKPIYIAIFYCKNMFYKLEDDLVPRTKA